MWVIAGTTGAGGLNDVWSSPDGVNWTQATGAAAFSMRLGQTSVVYGAPSSMWVIGGFDGGYKNDVWSSTDGATWNSATPAGAFSGRYGHASVVYNGQMWVIGGFNGASLLNDVWSSTDGITWNSVLPATGSASATQFSGRAGLEATVYNGAMYVAGGFDGIGPRVNDVWSSTDGMTWTQLTAAAPWAGREEPSLFVYNNALWVVAGRTGTGLMNDVWTSTDGSTWTPVSTTAIFGPRYEHTSLVFDAGTGPEMWVIAGFGGGPLNDVWHSP